MSPPISPTVKERVFQLHLEGKGRNEIAEILNLSHIRISQGSVTNILRTYKANTVIYDNRPKASEPSPSPSQLQTSSTSMEEAQIAARQPLSIDAKGSEEPKGHDYSKDAPSLHSSPEQGEAQPQIPIPVPAVPWSEVIQEIEDAKRQRRDELLLIDRRTAQLEEQKRRVDYEWRSIEQARYELDIRETRLLEVEPLIPVARQLQDLGTDINQFLAWVETINELGQIQKIDSRMAAYSIAQELRSYRQLGGLQKSIEQAQQRLALLNMFTAQKERALMVLMELQTRGVSLDEIYGLSKILDLDRLGKEWHYGTGVAQHQYMVGSG